jgi:Tol biopolymer transport system component
MPASHDDTSPHAAATSGSPDDIWLTFEASGSLWAIRADGSQLHEIPIESLASEPAYSPDGRSIAYSTGMGISVLDLATRKTRIVTTGDDTLPTWSPDGKRIAFERFVDIWLVDADGKNEHQFVIGPPPGMDWWEEYRDPVFTPDGASLIYDRRGAIEIADLDGPNRRALIDLGESAKDNTSVGMGAVSPDGNQITLDVTCNGETLPVLRIVALADVAQTCKKGRVVEGAPLPAYRSAWGANGLVAYTTIDSHDLYVVRAGGGTPKNLMTKANNDAIREADIKNPTWSPPGGLVP